MHVENKGMEHHLSEAKGLGLELKLTRLRAGLNQNEVAIRLGIHPGRLSEMECGWRRPSPELLQRLRQLLGVGANVKKDGA